VGTGPTRIVIVGAGHAGGSVAAQLRQFGWSGSITLIGDERLPPYQRPPLSKAWLKGEASDASLLLRGASFYETRAITLRLGEQVVAINRSCSEISLASGETIAYDRLILALGSVPRALDVSARALRGVLALRSADDAARLKAMLCAGRKLVVIGGGYIGLEVAATARSMGADVVVIEREPRLLSRVASPALSAFFQHHHTERGVRVELGVQVEALEGAGGALVGVRLTDGRFISSDIALIGVGVVPADALARAAGLACHDGVVVDEAARSSDPAIYAIGDCAHRPLPRYGRSMRLESVANALEMARQAAADLTGRDVPPPEVPFFWSDQFDLRLQIAGVRFDPVETAQRGDPESGGLALFHLGADATMVAVEAVNMPAAFMAGRMMIARRRRIDVALLRDPDSSLQQLVA